MSEETTEEVVEPFKVRVQKAREACGYVQFDEENKGQGFKYASAKAVLQKLQAACLENGLLSSTRDQLLNHHISEDGKKAHAVVSRRLILEDVYSGDMFVTEGIGSATDNSGREVLQASTAAIKYCLQSFGLMSWGDDPENMTAEEREDYKARNGGKKTAGTKAKNSSWNQRYK